MIPTSSVGQSWLSDGTQRNAPDIRLSLPVPHQSRYTALLADEYRYCIADAGSGRIVTILYVPISETNYTIGKDGDVDIITFRQTTTTAGGFVDTMYYRYARGTSFNFGDIEFHYGLTTAPSARRGLFVQKATGSVQLTLEPIPSMSLGAQYIGDFHFVKSGSRERGLKAYFGSASGMYRGDILYGLTHVSSSTQFSAHYNSAEAPRSSSLAANTIAVSSWMYSIGSSGVRTQPFNIGWWQTTGSSVDVFGTAGVRVPSGSVSASTITNFGSFRMDSGTIRLIRGSINATGSLNVFGGNVNIIGINARVDLTGDDATFALIGDNTTASLQGVPIGVVYSGSLNLAGLSASAAQNGALYVQTPLGNSYIRSRDKWYNFGAGIVDSASLLDGGTF